MTPPQLEKDIQDYMAKNDDAKTADVVISTARTNRDQIDVDLNTLRNSIIAGANSVRAAEIAAWEADVEAGLDPPPLTGLYAPQFFYVDVSLVKVDDNNVEIFYGVEVHTGLP